jgi:hypothetical protein
MKICDFFSFTLFQLEKNAEMSPLLGLPHFLYMLSIWHCVGFIDRFPSLSLFLPSSLQGPFFFSPISKPFSISPAAAAAVVGGTWGLFLSVVIPPFPIPIPILRCRCHGSAFTTSIHPSQSAACPQCVFGWRASQKAGYMDMWMWNAAWIMAFLYRFQSFLAQIFATKII